MSLYILSSVLQKAPLTLLAIPSLFDYERDGKIYPHELLSKAPLEYLLQIAPLVEGEMSKAAIRAYGMWCCSFARPNIQNRKLKQLLDVAQNVVDGLHTDVELRAANEEARKIQKEASTAFEANSARIVVEATMPLAGQNPRYSFSLELLCNAVDAFLAAYDETGRFKHFKTVQPLVLERTLKDGKHKARPFGFGLSSSSILEDYYPKASG